MFFWPDVCVRFLFWTHTDAFPRLCLVPTLWVSSILYISVPAKISSAAAYKFWVLLGSSRALSAWIPKCASLFLKQAHACRTNFSYGSDLSNETAAFLTFTNLFNGTQWLTWGSKNYKAHLYIMVAKKIWPFSALFLISCFTYGSENTYSCNLLESFQPGLIYGILWTTENLVNRAVTTMSRNRYINFIACRLNF